MYFELALCQWEKVGMFHKWSWDNWRSILINIKLQPSLIIYMGLLGPGSGRSAGEGIGYPLQYFGLENPTDRGAWLATVHGVSKSWT